MRAPRLAARGARSRHRRGHRALAAGLAIALGACAPGAPASRPAAAPVAPAAPPPPPAVDDDPDAAWPPGPATRGAPPTCDPAAWDRLNPACQQVCPDPPRLDVICDAVCPAPRDPCLAACVATYPPCDPARPDRTNPRCDGIAGPPRPVPITARAAHARGTRLTIAAGTADGIDATWRAALVDAAGATLPVAARLVRADLHAAIVEVAATAVPLDAAVALSPSPATPLVACHR